MGSPRKETSKTREWKWVAYQLETEYSNNILANRKQDNMYGLQYM